MITKSLETILLKIIGEFHQHEAKPCFDKTKKTKKMTSIHFQEYILRVLKYDILHV